MNKNLRHNSIRREDIIGCEKVLKRWKEHCEKTIIPIREDTLFPFCRRLSSSSTILRILDYKCQLKESFPPKKKDHEIHKKGLKWIEGMRKPMENLNIMRRTKMYGEEEPVYNSYLL